MVDFFLLKIKKIFLFLRAKISPSPIDTAFLNWVQDDGDNLLRYNYNLNKDSVVFDVGSYKGDFASEISARFQSQIYLFEPVEKFFTYSKNRFLKNPSIEVFHYGLGARNEILKVQEDEIRTRMKESEKGKIIEVKIKNIKEVIDELKVSGIDLLKINIEGGEYELLEKFYQMGYLTNVKNIQVQFHNFVQDADKKKQNITDILKISHECTWSYPYIWENWTLKKQL